MHASMNLDNDIQEGFILSIDGDIAHVRVAPNADCDNCGQCDIVHVELYAHNEVNAQIGQKVKFTMAQDNMIKIAFMIFMVPLLSIFAGLYIGSVSASYFDINGTAASFIGVLVFLSAAIFTVYSYDRKFRFNKKNYPKIIEVVR